jgi:hypothetical protein
VQTLSIGSIPNNIKKKKGKGGTCHYIEHIARKQTFIVTVGIATVGFDMLCYDIKCPISFTNVIAHHW